MHKITFSLTEFKNNRVDLELLNKEIKNTELNNKYLYNEYDNENCYLYFENELSNDELTLLQTIVSDHEGETIKKKYLIYQLIKNFDDYDPYKPPFDLDFTILGLHRVPYVENGELKKVVYYKDISMSENGELIYSTPVVEKDLTYIKKFGYYFSRITDIYWYFEDGTKDEINKKTVVLYYTKDEAIEAGNKRREYIVKAIQLETLFLIHQLHIVTSGYTDSSSYNNILVDYTKTFDENYLERIIEINNNKYVVINVLNENTLVLNDSVENIANSPYVVKLSIKQADAWGTQYLSLLSNDITKYIRGDIENMKRVIMTRDNYNSAITYIYGQWCMKDDKCYSCKVSSTTGEWNENDWKLEIDHSWMSYVIPDTNGMTIRDYLYSKIIE